MAKETTLTVGSHGDEIPDIYFVDKNGNKKPADQPGKDLGIDKQQLIYFKLQEGIDQFVIYGEIVFRDFGSARMRNIFAEGYDYLLIEGRSNHDEGGGFR